MEKISLYTLNCEGGYHGKVLGSTFETLFDPDTAESFGGVPDVMLFQEFNPAAQILLLEALETVGVSQDYNVLLPSTRGSTVGIATRRSVFQFIPDSDYYQHFKTTALSQHGVLFGRYWLVQDAMQRALGTESIEIWNAHFDAWFQPWLRKAQMLTLRGLLHQRRNEGGVHVPVIGGGDLNSNLFGENKRNDAILQEYVNVTGSLPASFDGKWIEETSPWHTLLKRICTVLPQDTITQRPDNVYICHCFNAALKITRGVGSDHYLINTLLTPKSNH